MVLAAPNDPQALALWEEMNSLPAVAGRKAAFAKMQQYALEQVYTLPLGSLTKVQVVRSNVKVTVKKVGYIVGAGDEMPDALRQLGLDVTVLSPSDLEQGDLSRFETIVCGVRAYNVRADVRASSG